MSYCFAYRTVQCVTLLISFQLDVRAVLRCLSCCSGCSYPVFTLHQPQKTLASSASARFPSDAPSSSSSELCVVHQSCLSPVTDIWLPYFTRLRDIVRNMCRLRNALLQRNCGDDGTEEDSREELCRWVVTVMW